MSQKGSFYMKKFSEIINEYEVHCERSSCDKCPCRVIEGTACVSMFMYLKCHNLKITKRGVDKALKDGEFKNWLGDFYALCHFGNDCRGCQYKDSILPNVIVKENKEPLCLSRFFYSKACEKLNVKDDDEQLWLYSGIYVRYKSGIVKVESVDRDRKEVTIIYLSGNHSTPEVTREVVGYDELSPFATRAYTQDEALDLMGKTLSYMEDNGYRVEMITSIHLQYSDEGSYMALRTRINGKAYSELKFLDACVNGLPIGVEEDVTND